MSPTLLLLPLTLLSLSRPCLAQSPSDAAAFLDVAVGGRPAALGGAYSALASDAYAPVWNPAGLPRARGAQAAATHLFYLQGISSDYLSLAVPFKGRHGLGISAQMLSSGDIETTDGQGRRLGTTGATYSAYTVAYGLALGPRWSLGASPKAIVASLDHESASAFAADLGASFAASKRLQLALVAANLGSRLRGDTLPSAARLGGAYEALPGVLTALEVARSFSGAMDVRAGLEWTAYPGFALRAGGQGREGVKPWETLSTGLGFAVWGQRLDYAWVPAGALGSSHFISLVVGFGKPR